ncbi:8-oxo-dGTP pyrophosphatase MutT, NUDIX family [Asanoa hainanensis]|uniref:8-oxo-dGTP pyrophosphatase MutT, NUDIX family n=1 Tax=Asanoa hainanensis TaxID=560556 RepID=A0A239PAN8_9ACTN|nr:NUDIX domain-containing protein [Asanoa hainanensis]SNT64216.1 8-oxo-dGTP pyrophosphatase MutT, NUDIX family [Asanoa hainanensis]
MSRAHVAEVIAGYLARHPAEAERLAPLTTALTEEADVVSRKTFVPGHVTASAVVLDPAGRMLHIRHSVFKRWLQPGGHLEPGDTTLVGAAQREVEEETGIALLTLADDTPCDIGVHPIAANPARDEAAHHHFDVRYLFTTVTAPATRLRADEVHGIAWLPPDEVEQDFRQKVRAWAAAL